MGGPEIVLKGNSVHRAKLGTNAHGTMRSVEYAIQSLDEVAASLVQRIADTRKRLVELTAQSEQPYEYEARLASLSLRQQEIADALDLTKSQASSRVGSGESDEPPGEIAGG
jgi:predicted XRE-type DNA-binding protein